MRCDVLAVSTAAVLLFAPAYAEGIAAPEGDVVLTVTGNLPITNVDKTLQFDRATLAALDDTQIITSTNWTEGLSTFQGVSLSSLTELLGVEEGTLRATAINDYSVEIPVADAVEGGPIIAYSKDGEEMSIRDKGPLWVIYPFDSSPEYRTAVIFSRSIWQLDRIEVVE